LPPVFDSNFWQGPPIHRNGRSPMHPHPEPIVEGTVAVVSRAVEQPIITSRVHGSVVLVFIFWL